MRSFFDDLGTKQRISLGISLLLIATAWIGASTLDNGLVVSHRIVEGTPLQFILPLDADGVPGVVVAHGFGGSKQFLLGFGYAFARAGYGVVLLDFPGHAANPAPLDDNLLDGLYAAVDALTARPEVDGGSIALLGHSMGSGAVMRAGIERQGEYAAVIAVSPTSAEVSPSAPPNLLLMAGALEPRFVENAEELFARAGGRNADISAGMARELEIIPGVEHITILFNADSRQAALDWLDETFQRQSPALSTDLRMLWYGLHLTGWLLLASVFVPASKRWLSPLSVKPGAFQTASALLFPFLVTLLFALLPSLAVAGSVLGLTVGGSLALWFLVLGTAMIFVVRYHEKPSKREIVMGVLYFGLLWLAMGLLAQFTWMQWFLIPARLQRWPLIALSVLPWKYSLGLLLAGMDGRRRFAAWFAYALVLTSALLMAAFLVPGMFVLTLIAPVIPLVLAVDIWLGSLCRTPWSYGLGSALFFGWMIASFFPLG